MIYDMVRKTNKLLQVTHSAHPHHNLIYITIRKTLMQILNEETPARVKENRRLQQSQSVAFI